MGIWARMRNEVVNLDPRFSMARWLTIAFPPLVGNRLRTSLLRLGGLRIGRGSAVGGSLSVQGGGRPARRIVIGEDCWINDSCLFDASADITIGSRVAIAQGVMILTNTHETGPHQSRAGRVFGSPVVVGDGSWLGARCTVLPGVTVGNGAIVAAGAVVNRSVPPDTMVAGVPARVVRVLAEGDQRGAD